MSAKIFKKIRQQKFRRNKFDLSHEKRLSADMFKLIPVLLDDCIPGDKWKIGNEIVIRMNPLAAPIMHELNCYVHYYFVPYRLLWDQFEDFITGGADGKFGLDQNGKQIVEIPTTDWLNGTLVWSPGSLWDYFGFPTNEDGGNIVKSPIVFPYQAYAMIYNHFYRDENLEPEIDIHDPSSVLSKNPGNLFVRAWEKDYFTSMLPWQQRGIAPAVPIEGSVSLKNGQAVFNLAKDFSSSSLLTGSMGNFRQTGYDIGFGMTGDGAAPANFKAYLDENYVTGSVDLNEASTFDVSDIRLSFSIQRFLERNARGGVRYPEFLKAHFPAFPRDDRLQRPEYIGGSKTPIIVSEVLQTSQSNPGKPQGNMAGHGLSADRTYCGNYNVQEFGLIMGIMSIMPRTMYSQGIDRVWLKESKYDFYFPEFANLSEQAVYVEELYNYTPAVKDRVIGYQGRYDEYRFKRNTIHGLFRTDFNYWHMGRKFGSAPTLNSDLVRPNATEQQAMKRVLAVETEPMFLISFGNKCHVTRPMPYMAEPGGL
jgi:hypothetical protein